MAVSPLFMRQVGETTMFDALKVFLLVAKHESFSGAAAALGLTRPAVSHRIKQLEAHFGVQLMARTTRRVSLTPAGRLLAQHAERIFAAADEMHAAMKQLRENRQSRLTVGASTLPAEKFLSPLLVKLQSRLSEHGVQIYVQVGNTDQVLAWLEERAIDLALIGCDVRVPHFECRPFATDALVLALPPGLDVPDPLPLAQLKTLPLILREPGSATRQAVLRHLASHGLTPADLKVVAEMGSSDSIKAAVRAGVGCAFFSTTQLADGGFQTRHLEGVDLCRKLSLCWRKDGPFSPPFQLFLDELPFLLSERLS